jgi:hypothetical protein
MRISKILLCLQTSGPPQEILEDIELSGDQGAFIPQVGDTYLLPSYSGIVESRRFEFRNGMLIVVLVCCAARTTELETCR